MNIDYETLEIQLRCDIHPRLLPKYESQIPTIIQNARETSLGILVEHSDFYFLYDKETYEQLEGGGMPSDNDNTEEG